MVENNVESVRENDRYLEAIINRKKRTIPIASIEYVESRGRKIVLHLGCGEMTFYSKISEIEEKLVNNGFVRCLVFWNLLSLPEFVRVHQSFMVRMADISKISRTSIKCGKIEVPVSRRYYGELRKMVME